MAYAWPIPGDMQGQWAIHPRTQETQTLSAESRLSGKQTPRPVSATIYNRAQRRTSVTGTRLQG